MGRLVAMGRLHGRHGRRVLLACLFGLILLLGHQLVMATERHATQMGMGHGPSMRTSLMAAPTTLLAAGDTDNPQPLTTWDECLGQNGVLPLLLLLLAFAGTWRLGATSLTAAITRWWGLFSLSLHPPPLKPARRRALLQVFRN